MARALLRLAVLAGVTFVAACRTPGPQVAGLPERVDYNFHVKPILSDRCFKCHGPDDAARKAGLRLDTADGPYATLASGARAVVPGRPGRSELVRRILSDDPAVMMPAPESHLTLDDREKALLIKWIEQGAEWKPHWAFTAPVKPTPPTPADPSRVRNPIDRFVLANVAAHGLQPSHEAPKETLIRRVTLALTGLPPTLEDVDAFLADTSPNAYETVVDRLLASPAYGERMAADWLDLSRYADSHGYQDDGMRPMWPWRDWVIESFNRNQRIDEFLTWQLAGDLLPSPSHEQRLATAFNRHHMQSQEGGIVDEEYRVEYVADRVNTLGRAVLGVSLECARCHDHKYDPITQREYFELFAFFNNNNEAGQIPYSGMPSPTLVVADASARATLDTLAERRRALEPTVAPDNPAFDDGFATWLAAQTTPPATDPAPPGLVAHLPLDAIREEFEVTPATKTTPEKRSRRVRFENVVPGAKPASLSGDRDRVPQPVPSPLGRGVQLAGDSSIQLPSGIGFFDRHESFSVGIWLRIDKARASGPLVMRSGAVMNGNRGYGVFLEPDGTLRAFLAHTAPDSQIEVRTTTALKAGTWTHVAFVYDGSSRANGLRLFVDGTPTATRVIVDNLQRSILHSGIEGNQSWGDMRSFGIGGLAEETLQDVSVDDLRIYATALTALEVEGLVRRDHPLARALALPERPAGIQAALREHYVRRVSPAYRKALTALTAVRREENLLLTRQVEVMVMRERQDTRPTFVLARGAYDAPTDRVQPGTPSSMPAFAQGAPRTRLGLAQWLVSPSHPLTARVFVNRTWAQLFGRGIVPTVGDFGNQGRLPSHPELLDWLAVTFIESGWDLKALVRQIVTSATFRQSSIASESARAIDPENEWLARGPAYRLSAEQVRDAALHVSGLMVPTRGGPSVYPYQPPGLWEELATRNATTYTQGTGDDLYRRSLYTVWKRSTPPPSAIGFDAAERLSCTVSRQRTSTPLQALILLNDPQYVESARVLAERVLRQGGTTPEARVTYAFRRVTSRQPSPTELASLVTLYDREYARFVREPAAARALAGAGSLPRDTALRPAEAAAWTVVASTILNLDDAVFTR